VIRAGDSLALTSESDHQTGSRLGSVG